MNRLIICSVLICVSYASLNAQKKKPTSDPCKNAMSQAEINLCTRRSYEAANNEMIKIYSLVKKEVSTYEGALEKLETSQVKWVEYRDAACESEAVLYTGGSIRPTILNSCLTSITTERTRRLKLFLEEK